VVRYCDGWMPIPLRAPDLIAQVADLRQRAARAGRDPGSISVSLYGAPADDALLQQYRAAGIDRIVFGLPPAGRDTVLPLMDRYAAVARRFA